MAILRYAVIVISAASLLLVVAAEEAIDHSQVLFARGNIYTYAYKTRSLVEGDHSNLNCDPVQKDTAALRPTQTVEVTGGGLQIHATVLVRVVGEEGDAALCELRVENPTFSIYDPAKKKFTLLRADPEGHVSSSPLVVCVIIRLLVHDSCCHGWCCAIFSRRLGWARRSKAARSISRSSRTGRSPPSFTRTARRRGPST